MKVQDAPEIRTKFSDLTTLADRLGKDAMKIEAESLRYVLAGAAATAAIVTFAKLGSAAGRC